MATQTYKGKKHTNLADCKERRRAWCRYFDMKREKERLEEIMAEVGKHMGKVLYVNKWDKQFVSTRYRLAARALARRQIRKRC